MIVFTEMFPVNQSYIPLPEERSSVHNGTGVAHGGTGLYYSTTRRKTTSGYSKSDCSCISQGVGTSSDYSSLSTVSLTMLLYVIRAGFFGRLIHI